MLRLQKNSIAKKIIPKIIRKIAIIILKDPYFYQPKPLSMKRTIDPTINVKLPSTTVKFYIKLGKQCTNAIQNRPAANEIPKDIFIVSKVFKKFHFYFKFKFSTSLLREASLFGAQKPPKRQNCMLLGYVFGSEQDLNTELVLHKSSTPGDYGHKLIHIL